MGAVRSVARRAAPLPRPVLAGAALALSGALPPGAGLVAALAAIIVLGVPHGALDGEIARTALRPRWGQGWFLVFSAPYLALAACVLLAWRMAPLTTLAGFLALSVVHFGAEDAPDGRWLDRFIRGGLPVALPVLLRPDSTARLLGTVAGMALDALPAWLVVASLVWLTAATLRLFQGPRRADDLAIPALLLLAYAVLPPITAFALYFVCIHGPAHVAGMIADPRAPRVRSQADADVRALPLTGLTLLLGAGLWFSYAGPAPDRLLELTLQGLAALTLPHMLLDRFAR